jgi:O-antigen/teichoic acid export membrane protein
MIKRNLFYNILLSVSQLIFPLITFPYASRILGPQGIGTVNFIDSFTQYFLLFAALGIPVYGIREVSRMGKNTEELNKTFNEVFTIHLISTVIFSIVYLLVAILVKSIRVHFDLVLVGIFTMYFSVFAVEWFYQGIEQFAYITKRTLIVRSLSIGLLFVFLKPGSKPVTYALIFAFITLINGIVNAVLLKKHIKFGLKNLTYKKHIKPLVLIFSSTIAVSVYTLMDNMILGFMKGETAVGIYSTALKVVRIPFALIIAIGSVIVPQVSRAYNENRMQDVNELINKSFTFTCIVGIPIVIGLFVSSAFLVTCFAGKNFIAAGGVIQILSPAVMLIGMNSILGTQLLTPMGKEKHLLKMAVICMFFSLLCNLALIPLFSYNGAAITNVLTEVLLVCMLFYAVNKEKPVTIAPRIFFESLTGGLMFIPLAYFIRQFNLNYFIKEVTVIISCSLFYLCYIWLFNQNRYVNNLKMIVTNRFNLIVLNKINL